ncbi:MAG TPA: hypothetical protein VHD88_08800, partial [Pyrinomonadaceae bacterium]|nr:hypothetical protein [Pyrinomonadaceae bacterium]
MPGLKRLLCSLILTAGILSHSPSNTHAQSPDAKPKGTASISGRVTINGKAAAGIPVAAFGGDSFNRRAAAAQTITDSEGHYRLSGLAPAQYQVATLTPSLTTAERGSETSYGFVYFGSSKNIILAAGEEVEDIDLKLVRGGVITGRVSDADNKPVIEEHVSLQLVDENGNPSRTGSPLPYNSQMYQTDDRGMYRIYGLQAGRYKVSVGADTGVGSVAANGRGYYPRTYYPDVNDVAKATVVELGEGSEAANIDIQVGRRADTYSVAGRVVDSETGQAIAGARVGYGPAPQNQERFSAYYSGFPAGSRGEFRFEGLAPGRYGVNVSSEYEGGHVYSDPVYFEVVDKDVSGLEVKALHGLSLSGIVVADGETQKDLLAQLAGVRISASVSSTSKPQIYTSGTSLIAADGSFQINGLRPGRVGMGLNTQGPGLKRPSITRIEHDGVGLTQGFELQPGQSISGLRVVISYGTGAIRGTVRFEGGAPPPDARFS